MANAADLEAMRKKRLAALHLRAREVGLIDAGGDRTAYRAWLAERFGGVTSAADLDVWQLGRALSLLKDGHDRRLIAKIDAQIEALGKHRQYAEGIARRMFGKDRLEFCTDAELHKIVAALNYQIAREAQQRT